MLLFAVSPSAHRYRRRRRARRLPNDLEPAGVGRHRRRASSRICRKRWTGLRAAHVELKIISGDNPETVAALARQAGLPKDAVLVSGLDLEAMNDGRVR